MKKFNKIKSVPAYLPLINIDTDMIIPKQFLKTIKRTGLGKSLFYEMRYDEKGKIIKNFILNNEPYSKSKILLTGKNFGCGSSREHAVWAIKDFGIQAIISTSFADIFSRNSFKNGILLISVNKDILEKLFKEIESNKEYILSINVLDQSITGPKNLTVGFEINESDKERIIHGYDDIAITLKRKNQIIEYEQKMKKNKPWLFNDE